MDSIQKSASFGATTSSRHFALFRFTPRPMHRFSVGAQVRLSGQRQPLRERRAASSRPASGKASSTSISRTAIEVQINYQDGYELLTTPFTIARGVTIPPGGYHAQNAHRGGPVRTAARGVWRIDVEVGPFYGGTRTELEHQQRPRQVQPSSAPSIRVCQSTGSHSRMAASPPSSSARASPTR